MQVLMVEKWLVESVNIVDDLIVRRLIASIC